MQDENPVSEVDDQSDACICQLIFRIRDQLRGPDDHQNCVDYNCEAEDAHVFVPVDIAIVLNAIRSNNSNAPAH